MNKIGFFSSYHFHQYNFLFIMFWYIKMGKQVCWFSLMFSLLVDSWHSYNFQLQLQSLMETLSSTEPHYIRCVKPNNLLKPAVFENANVIQQLRCGVRFLKLY
jgi:hypothetical protein